MSAKTKYSIILVLIVLILLLGYTKYEKKEEPIVYVHKCWSGPPVPGCKE